VRGKLILVIVGTSRPTDAQCTFLEKPSGDRIRIRLLVRKNLEDFRLSSSCERGEISKGVVVSVNV